MPGAAHEAQVLVVGEALMDVVMAAGVPTAHPGGSPANVAVGLARLGCRTSLLTALGRDVLGVALERHFQDEGVRLFPGSIREDEPTSSATVALDADGAATYHFDVRWSLPEQDLDQHFDLLHTGSIAAFLAPGASTVRRLFERARPSTLLSFDPNIRPQLLPERADTVKAFHAMADLVDIVKLSDEDAAWLWPGRDVHTVLDELLARGAGLIVITRGAQGALLATGVHRCDLPAAPTTVKDTVGAGDSYMAALLSLIIGAGRLPRDHQELKTLGTTAARAAAITVSRAGAQPPTSQELHRLRAPHVGSGKA
ncbi:hypothetical protein AVL61_15155 [Kocuria rosea subsp. polaris]|uniref:Carbohydrate kinase PfkB domain-containing protein n=1 Tax=Kocuria rosea subsp. polaris TaxID=136273 RepID=A0A0W8I6J9_KOCRO|nr:carbohydrate kinase [Kocuria polaris]KUG53866.1 hypothetical protein AVL61_15155 [Kocuria polaris]